MQTRKVLFLTCY